MNPEGSFPIGHQNHQHQDVLMAGDMALLIV